LITHDGKPTQQFAASVRASPDEYEQFVSRIEDTLKDHGYTREFFFLTGMSLDITPSHERASAEAIAKALLDQNPTLQ
jgi:hypothetical protein